MRVALSLFTMSKMISIILQILDTFILMPPFGFILETTKRVVILKFWDVSMPNLIFLGGAAMCAMGASSRTQDTEAWASASLWERLLNK